jgi:hypothetical protein
MAQFSVFLLPVDEVSWGGDGRTDLYAASLSGRF